MKGLIRFISNPEIYMVLAVLSTVVLRILLPIGLWDSCHQCFPLDISRLRWQHFLAIYSSLVGLLFAVSLVCDLLPRLVKLFNLALLFVRSGEKIELDLIATLMPFFRLDAGVVFGLFIFDVPVLLFFGERIGESLTPYLWALLLISAAAWFRVVSWPYNPAAEDWASDDLEDEGDEGTADGELEIERSEDSGLTSADFSPARNMRYLFSLGACCLIIGVSVILSIWELSSIDHDFGAILFVGYLLILASLSGVVWRIWVALSSKGIETPILGKSLAVLGGINFRVATPWNSFKCYEVYWIIPNK